MADEVVSKLWDRMGRLRVGDPLDKNTDVGAINSAEQLAPDRGAGRAPARRRARCAARSPATLPDRGYWFAPTLFTDVSPAHRIAVEEIFGPVVSVLTFRTQAEAIEKANNSTLRPGRRDLDRQGRQGVRGGLRAAGRRGLAEHLQPLRPDGGVRRLQGERLRPRGRAGRPAPLPARVDERAPRRPQDVQAVDRRRVRALGVRALRPRRRTSNIPRASRKDVRDAVAAARKACGPWAARTAYNRGQILYRAAEALGVARATRPRADAAREVERRDRRARCTTPAGPTSSRAVLGGVNPVAAPFLSFSLPEPTGVVGVVAPDEPPLLGLVAEIAPALAAGNTVVAILSERRPLRGLDLGEVLGVSDVPGGVVNLLSGRRSRARPGARRPPRPQRDRRRRGRRRARRRARPARLRDHQARAPRRRRRRPTRPPSPTRSRASRPSPSSRPPGTRSAPSPRRTSTTSGAGHRRRGWRRGGARR